MPEQGLSGRSETGAVGADDAHTGGRPDDLEGIVHRNALGYADGEGDARIVGFVECVGGKGRRNEDAGVRRTGGIDCLAHGIEDGNARRRL